MRMTDAALAALTAQGPFIVMGEHLVKHRPTGELAVDDVSIAIARGTVHAVVGVTGSGRSALLRTLSGIEPPSSGRLSIDGRIFLFGGSRDVMGAGLGWVPRRPRLLAALTVAQNVVLGALPMHGSFLGVLRGRESVRDIGGRHGLQLDPDARVADLSPAQKQRVEIVKALHRGARMLFLDDPTALLSRHECEPLFDSLRSLAAAGVTVVLTSRRPDQVAGVAEAYTVLREGRVVGRGRMLDATVAELSSLIAGTGASADDTGRPRPALRLRVSNLSLFDDASRALLDRVSFDVGAGEIMGIGAAAGREQHHLEAVLSGRVPAASGTVLVDGVASGTASDDLQNHRIHRVRKGELATGSAGDDRQTTEPLDSGMTMFDTFQPQVGRLGWMDARVAAPRAREIIRRHRLGATHRPPVVGRDAEALRSTLRPPSNSMPPQVVVATLAAEGFDTAEGRRLRDVLLEWRAAGAAIVLVSANAEALIDVSDRIGVLFEGRLAAHSRASTVTPQVLAACIAGMEREATVMAGAASCEHDAAIDRLATTCG